MLITVPIERIERNRGRGGGGEIFSRSKVCSKEYARGGTNEVEERFF